MADMADRLNTLSAFVDNGNLNTQLESPEELDQMQRWLQNLSNNINMSNGYGGTTATNASSPMSTNGASLQYPHAFTMDEKPTYMTPNADMQAVYPQQVMDDGSSFVYPTSNCLYPSNDIYVRSQVPSQYPMATNMQQYEQSPYVMANNVGNRQHFMAAPSVATNYWGPSYQTTQNFTSANGASPKPSDSVDFDIKSKSIPSVGTPSSPSERVMVDDMPRIKKEEMTDHENKKQMVSMLNVFSSPDNATAATKEKAEAAAAVEETVVEEATSEPVSQAENLPVKEESDIMTLLSSDISGMSIKESNGTKSPYADLSEALSDDEAAADVKPVEKRQPVINQDVRQKHYQLVKRLSEALQSMARDQRQQTNSLDRKTAAVSGAA